MEREITIQFTYEVTDEDRVRASLVMPMTGADGSTGMLDVTDIEWAVPAAWMKLAGMDLFPHAMNAGIQIKNATVVGMS